MPRRLRPDEIDDVLDLDVPASLATMDAGGYPHVTPLWFLYADGAVLMTSLNDKPHVRRLLADRRVGVCVHVEEPELDDGERTNRQVRLIADAELSADTGGEWTRRITMKYLHGPGARQVADRRSAEPRTLIRVPLANVIAVASR